MNTWKEKEEREECLVYAILVLASRQFRLSFSPYIPVQIFV